MFIYNGKGRNNLRYEAQNQQKLCIKRGPLRIEWNNWLTYVTAPSDTLLKNITRRFWVSVMTQHITLVIFYNLAFMQVNYLHNTTQHAFVTLCYQYSRSVHVINTQSLCLVEHYAIKPCCARQAFIYNAITWLYKETVSKSHQEIQSQRCSYQIRHLTTIPQWCSYLIEHFGIKANDIFTWKSS